ncbi:DUF5320 domain-containing protein [Patescibacteria group bacterium]|nr:DUF5320 domain-containing protein [Patescibacteria group bacterium]
MPNLDGTGPTGNGPQNGMGRGNCATNDAPNQLRGRRFRNGPGRFAGNQMCRFQNPPTIEEEESMLNERLAEIKKIKENKDKK